MTDPVLAADPSLAAIYRAVAVVKGIIAFGFVCVLVWRVRSAPISKGRVCVYCLCVGSMIGAVALLVSQRTFGIVPFMFEGALLSAPLLALSDKQAWMSGGTGEDQG
ncbi:MAG: hypothetical protein IPP90_14000 [Gemmatimonadaceae bacterium]|nr:hypothetical protein [Gemmatimonadaceae bacterium]